MRGLMWVYVAVTCIACTSREGTGQAAASSSSGGAGGSSGHVVTSSSSSASSSSVGAASSSGGTSSSQTACGAMTACGQQCVDLATDLNHCGGCGERCVAADAQVTVRCASGCFETHQLHYINQAATALAQDATHLYWTTGDSPAADATLVRWPKTGGPVETITGGPLEGFDVQARAMVVHGGTVFWVSNRGVWAADLASGVRSQLAQTTGSFLHLAVDGDAVYALDGGNNQLVRVDRLSGIQTVLVQTSSPRSVAVDATHIYWSAGLEILRLAKSGGTPQALWQNMSNPAYDIALDDTHVYWVGYHGAPYRVAKAGGTAQLLANGTYNCDQVDVHGGFLYWAGQTGGLARVPITGGAVQQLSSNSYADDVAADDVAYWVGLFSEGGGVFHNVVYATQQIATRTD